MWNLLLVLPRFTPLGMEERLPTLPGQAGGGRLRPCACLTPTTHASKRCSTSATISVSRSACFTTAISRTGDG